MMESVGNPPRETVIIGVEPAEVDWGLDLTPTLEGKLPDIVRLVVEEAGPSAALRTGAKDKLIARGR